MRAAYDEHPRMGAATVALAALALVSGACGNLSNQDLLFLAGIPRAEELALEVEGEKAPAGALTSADAVGQQAEYYRTAFDLATGINAGVGQLLDLVDTLGRGFPPTERTESARIWGPIQNVDGKGFTLRLEIRRSERDDGRPRFTFCLQVSPDSDYTGEEGGCDPGNSAGLRNVLWGSYNPQSASAGARSGSGEIRLDFEVMHAIGAGQQNERGLLAITYDFTRGGAAKSLGFDWTFGYDVGSIPQTASYEYSRTTAGEVDFYFQFTADLVGGGFMNPFSEARETATINACWTEGGPGRGDAQIREGDVQPGHAVSATECWDAEHRRTFFDLVVTQDPSMSQTEGDPSACPDC